MAAQRMAVASPVRERSCSPTPHDQRATSLSLGTLRPTVRRLDTSIGLPANAIAWFKMALPVLIWRVSGSGPTCLR